MFPLFLWFQGSLCSLCSYCSYGSQGSLCSLCSHCSYGSGTEGTLGTIGTVGTEGTERTLGTVGTQGTERTLGTALADAGGFHWFHGTPLLRKSLPARTEIIVRMRASYFSRAQSRAFDTKLLAPLLYQRYESLILLLRPSSNLLDSLSSIPSPATPKKLLSEQFPF